MASLTFNHLFTQTIFTGSYCDSAGLSTPTGPCDGGYYCPEGQNVSAPAAYVCTPGHYCPIGNPVQTSCSSGTYQDQYGQVWLKNIFFELLMDKN